MPENTANSSQHLRLQDLSVGMFVEVNSGDPKNPWFGEIFQVHARKKATASSKRRDERDDPTFEPVGVKWIARVQGVATAAGCQLVATCDLAVAAESAQFATPGVHIGLFCSTPMVALSRPGRRRRRAPRECVRCRPRRRATRWFPRRPRLPCRSRACLP